MIDKTGWTQIYKSENVEIFRTTNESIRVENIKTGEFNEYKFSKYSHIWEIKELYAIRRSIQNAVWFITMHPTKNDLKIIQESLDKCPGLLWRTK